MENTTKGFVSIKDNCIGCGRCILECPAPETNISVYHNGQRKLKINAVNCISCGHCFNTCTHNARDFEDDTDEFLASLKAGESVSLIVSTCFYNTYGDKANKILGYLRSLGVNKIYDSAFGADVFVYLNAKFIKEYSGDAWKRPFILNSCPMIRNYIERYVPESLEYIIPVLSPPLCTAKYARKYLHDDSKLAYLSSCVSRRSEFEKETSQERIDYNVTLNHLMKRIGNVDFSDYKTESDLFAPAFGNIISADGGLRNYISSLFSDDEIIVNYSGLDERTRMLIESVKDKSVPHPLISCMYGCEYGCASGAGAEIAYQSNYDTYLSSLQRIRRESIIKKHRYSSHWELYHAIGESFMDIDPKDFTTYFTDRYRQLHEVPESVINDIFIKMRKTRADQRHVDCSTCGYRTCREMAHAVAKGYAHIEDCTRYVNDEFRRRLLIDDLTGLLSPVGFTTQAAQLLKTNRDKKYVICTGNINGLKTINDLYNFNIGSQVIVYVARMIESIILDRGICGILGGNNFVMCFENTEENLRRLMAIRYFDCGEMGINMPVTMRFGLCNVGSSKDISRLINNASFAMQKIVDRTRNSYTWYDNEMRRETTIEAAITYQMRQSMYNNEFTMHLQPQYNHTTGALVGAEALCRWIKPDGSIVSPGVFVPIFEKNGFIKKLDRFMWESAFRKIREWTDEGLSLVPISVNISRMSLVDDDILDVIKRMQDKYKIDTEMLHFEITESAYTADQKSLIRRISSIREMGFMIAMDDFGSGYSSLNTLKDIPIDILKLDMGFIRGESNVEKGSRIIAFVIRMAHSLGLLTVAEGVENIEQADFLKSLGCDVIQGYLYARPMPADEYTELLRNSKTIDISDAIIYDRNEIDDLFRRDSAGMRMFENYTGPAALFEYDAGKLDVIQVNDNLVDVLGYKEMTAVEFARTFSTRIDEKDRVVVAEAIGRAIKGEDSAVCMFGYERPDGKHIVIKARIWYIGNNGEVPVIYTLSDDVTDVLSYENHE